MTVVDEQIDYPQGGKHRPHSAGKVDTPASTTARTRELGAALRKWRERSGKPAWKVAAQCGWVGSTASRLENGYRSEWMSKHHVAVYATACEVPADARPALMELAAPEIGECWPRPHGGGLPDELPSLAFALWQASGLRCYDPTGIPALIQSPEYAALDIAARLGETADATEIANRVRQRLERHELLPHPDRTQLDQAGSLAEAVFYVPESVLRRLPGGAEGRSGQLLYLLSCQQRARIRVVPDRPEGLALAAGGFTLLRYERWPTVVCVSGDTVTLFLEGADHALMYQALAERMDIVALSDSESADLISSLI